MRANKAFGADALLTPMPDSELRLIRSTSLARDWHVTKEPKNPNELWCGGCKKPRFACPRIHYGKRVVLSRADLEALPHVKVTASEHSSAPVNFEGVTLKSVLEKAGVTFGDSMKGKRLTNCLLVEAADGYRAVIALPELDPAFTVLIEKRTS